MATQFINLSAGHLSGTLIIPLKGEGGPSLKNVSVRREQQDSTVVVRAESQWFDKPTLQSFVDFIRSSDHVTVNPGRESSTGKSLMVPFSADLSADFEVGVRLPMPSDDGTLSSKWSQTTSSFEDDDVTYVGEPTTYEDAEGTEHVTAKPFILTSIGSWSTRRQATDEDFDLIEKAFNAHFAEAVSDDSSDDIVASMPEFS